MYLDRLYNTTYMYCCYFYPFLALSLSFPFLSFTQSFSNFQKIKESRRMRERERRRRRWKLFVCSTFHPTWEWIEKKGMNGKSFSFTVYFFIFLFSSSITRPSPLVDGAKAFFSVFPWYCAEKANNEYYGERKHKHNTIRVKRTHSYGRREREMSSNEKRIVALRPHCHGASGWTQKARERENFFLFFSFQSEFEGSQ